MARTTLKEFAKRMRHRAEKLEFNVNRLKQEYANAIAVEIIPATPVDTGLHTARWQAGLGSPPVFSEAFIEGSFGSTKASNNRLAIDAAKAVIKQSRFGQTIFLSNNGPVITMLNRGWSKQAPAGFVQASILRGVTKTRGKFRIIEPR